MNFKVGQKLVCIQDYPNKHEKTQGMPMPKKDQIVSVFSIRYGRLTFVEFQLKSDDGRIIVFAPNFFRPLLGDSARSELISSFIEVVETSDCPIQTPQPCS